MNSETFSKLVTAYLNNSLSDEDRRLLSNLLMQEEYQDLLDRFMQQQQQQGYKMNKEYEASYQRMRHSLQARIGDTAPRKKALIWRMWPAAAALVILTWGIWYLMKGRSKVEPSPAKTVTSVDIKPGHDGAILTLADGSKLVLDSMNNGKVASQEGAMVHLANGALTYTASNPTPGEVLYNTLETPKGRQFKITLPDGTQVWLNAASSIRYPTQFTTLERRVEITGEAYFEVASIHQQGKKLPFIVKTNQQFEIEVVGTHFNVNAYANEPVFRTTLLEGKVKVNRFNQASAQTVVLKPGQQAALPSAGKPGSVQLIQADTAKVLAWKNGLFNFENAKLEEVMRQLERWYDIQVTYEAGIPDIEFIGKMTKDIPLSGLLIALERSDIHFRTEGRVLIVTP